MDNRTFKVAGISTDPKGSTKVRFANDYVGRKHTDIKLLELEKPMSKKEICDFLMSHTDFQTEVAQSAIASFVKRNIGSGELVIEQTSAPVTSTETTSI